MSASQSLPLAMRTANRLRLVQIDFADEPEALQELVEVASGYGDWTQKRTAE